MTNYLKIFAAVAVMWTTGFLAGAVEVELSETQLSVTNNYYKLILRSTDNWGIGTVSAENDIYALKCRFLLEMDQELPDNFPAKAAFVVADQNNEGVTAVRLVKKSLDEVIVEKSWQLDNMTLVEVMTFCENDMIRHNVTLSFDKSIGNIVYQMDSTDYAGMEGIFMPDDQRVTGILYGKPDPSSEWKLAWNPKRKHGFGMIRPFAENFAGFQYYMLAPEDGIARNVNQIQLYFKPQRYSAIPGMYQFSFYTTPAATPTTVEKNAAAINPGTPDISIVCVAAQKLIVQPCGTNSLTVGIRNGSEQMQTVTVATAQEWGLDMSCPLDRRELIIPAHATIKYDIPIPAAKEARGGVHCEVEIFDKSGKVIAAEGDYFAVSEFAPAAAGVGVLNVGQYSDSAAARLWVEMERRRTTGVMEYYAWAPSPVTLLVPGTDSWEPHTDSQIAFRATLSKETLRQLISSAHDNGMSILAWITGLDNFHEALKHPEDIQYCANGQPNIYVGKIWGDTRFAVLKSNLFSPARAQKWGEAMADSVEAFGWDGCRWDWAFLPASPNDPFYLGTISAEKLRWYDLEGHPVDELFPDVDRNGAEALNAWRMAVRNRHPNFIYGCNFSVSETTERDYPKYSDAALKQAMILLEYLLDCRSYNFEEWGEKLANAADFVRARKGVPIVGHMSGPTPGSTSLNLANWIAMLAGVKWWGISDTDLVYGHGRVRDAFMVRFGEYIFDPGWHRIGIDNINVSQSKKIIYRPFIFERESKDGREVAIRLVNRPDDGNSIAQKHLPPPFRHGIELTVLRRPGEELGDVWALLPRKKPEAVRLHANDIGKVTLPELQDAAIVIFRFRNEKNVSPLKVNTAR